MRRKKSFIKQKIISAKNPPTKPVGQAINDRQAKYRGRTPPLAALKPRDASNSIVVSFTLEFLALLFVTRQTTSAVR